MVFTLFEQANTTSPLQSLATVAIDELSKFASRNYIDLDRVPIRFSRAIGLNTKMVIINQQVQIFLVAKLKRQVDIFFISTYQVHSKPIFKKWTESNKLWTSMRKH